MPPAWTMVEVAHGALAALGPAATLAWLRAGGVPTAVTAALPPAFYRAVLDAGRLTAAARAVGHQVVETVDTHLWTQRGVHLAPQLRAVKQAETEGLGHLMKSFARVSVVPAPMQVCVAGNLVVPTSTDSTQLAKVCVPPVFAGGRRESRSSPQRPAVCAT